MVHAMRATMVALTTGLVGLLSAGGQARADAVVNLSGPLDNQGPINLAPGSYSLWQLLGGSTSSMTTKNPDGSTTTTYGGITTTTPSGDNAKNAILRDYLVVTNGAGERSVVSLGEIDPTFVGDAASGSKLITVSGSSASLSFLGAGAAGRDLLGVASIQLIAAPALPGPINPPPQSVAVALSGNSSHPGSYDLNRLTNEFTPATETVNNDTYTGVPLWTFLDPNSDILDQYVVTAGTDGYQVVLSLAELDPGLGGDPGDLLPYADTNGNFPMDGVARTILPGDTPFAHGRWLSNVAIVDIAAVPEPGGLAVILSGLMALLLSGRARQRSNARIG
jgi:hypothetical protein